MHTILFWHFLKNLNFESKYILEYIRTQLSGIAWLFSGTIGTEHFKY